ncbi:hypothetical protein Tco_1421115 [Tanacetum coccineum]
MHTRASNSELVEPLPEPERTLQIEDFIDEKKSSIQSKENNPPQSPRLGNSNSDTKKIIARMDAMTIKMDAQYKELQSRAK